MDNLELYEKIDAYLRNQLSAQEKEAFEADIARDEDLAMEVEIQRLYIDAGEVLIEQDLKEQVNTWKAEIREDQNTAANKPVEPATTSFWRYLLILAAVIVIGLLVWYLFRLNPIPASEDQSGEKDRKINLIDSLGGNRTDSTTLDHKKKQPPSENDGKEIPKGNTQNRNQPTIKGPIADLLETYNESPTSVIRSPQPGEIETPAVIAARHYNDGKYIDALEQLKKIPSDAPNIDNIRLLEAYCYFQLNNYAKAEAMFSPLATQGLNQADWGLVMTYLAQGPNAMDKLRAKLESIQSEPFHEYGPKAKGLLKDLEKIKK